MKHYGLVFSFVIGIVLRPSLSQAQSPNSRTNSASGKWEVGVDWSLGVPPTNTQSAAPMINAADDSELNVTNYGAVGDDSHLDNAAFDVAFLDLKTNTSTRTLLIPPGAYNLAPTLIDGGTNETCLYVCCLTNAVIKLYGTLHQNTNTFSTDIVGGWHYPFVVTLHDCSHVTLIGCGIGGIQGANGGVYTAQTESVNGLSLQGTNDNITVNGLVWSDLRFPIILSAPSRGMLPRGLSRDIEVCSNFACNVANPNAEDLGADGAFVSTPVDGLNAHDNVVSNAHNMAFEIFSASNAVNQHIIIRNNRTVDAKNGVQFTQGVPSEDFFDVEISGNDFYSERTDGGYGVLADMGTSGNHISGLLVENNVIHCPSNSVGFQVGIGIGPGVDGVARNNRIVAMKQTGYYISWYPTENEQFSIEDGSVCSNRSEAVRFAPLTYYHTAAASNAVLSVNGLETYANVSSSYYCPPGAQGGGGVLRLNGGNIHDERGSAVYAYAPATVCVFDVSTNNNAAFFGGTAAVIQCDPDSMDDDGDGLPNSWERSYGLDPLNPADANADPDGDGLSNLQEYQAGTDPTNSASVFHIIEIRPQGADMLLTWTAVGGKQYVLQTTTSYGGGFSNNLIDLNSPIVAPGTGETTVSVLHLGAATNAPARYYRVRLVP